MSNEEITLKAFDELCKNLLEQKAKCQEIELGLKAETDKLGVLQKKVMSYMEELGKEKYVVDGMGSVFITNHFSAQVPKTIEDKKAFFKWLEERGMFYEYVNINSQSLASLVKHEEEEALKRGEIDFKIAGIGESKWNKRLSIRKK